MAIDRKSRYQKRHRLLQLRVFSRAAELANMSRAAEALSIAPQGAALHVRELEHELDAELFVRKVHGVALTPAGECLYGLVSPLLEEIGGLAERFDGLGSESASEGLYIVSEGGMAVEVASRAFRNLLGERSALGFRVQTGPFDQGLKRLRDGKAGLVFGAAREVPDEYAFDLLLSSQWVVITPLGHPLAEREKVTIREIGAWPLIAPSPALLPLMPRGDETTDQDPEVQCNIVVEANGWPTVYAFVQAGLGVSVADRLAIPEDARVSVVPLVERFPNHPLGIFRRSDRPEPILFRPFVEALRSEYPDASPEPGDAPA